MERWVIVSKHENDDAMKWKVAHVGVKLITYDSREEAVARCNGKYVANVINGEGSKKMRYGVVSFNTEDVKEIDYNAALEAFAARERK